MSIEDTCITKISDLPNPDVEGDAFIVCIYGPLIGRMWSIPDNSKLTIGRGEQNRVVLDIDNVSRRHCEFTVKDGQAAILDLGSTNGTFVNGTEIPGAEAPKILKNSDHIKVGGAIFKYLTGGNVESLYHEEIYRMTITDGLTQVHNRRFFMDALDREMARCARFNRPLHLLMMDVDHFKKLNDTYGHIAGDMVLKDLAGLIGKTVRKEETFARFGGEEFAVLIPEVEKEKVRIRAEKILSLVSSHHFIFDNQRMKVTISAGGADMPEKCDSPQSFIHLADTRLYEAKKRGRNCVVL